MKSNDLYKATIRIQNYVETWKNQKQPEQQKFVQQEVLHIQKFGSYINRFRNARFSYLN